MIRPALLMAGLLVAGIACDRTTELEPQPETIMANPVRLAIPEEGFKLPADELGRLREGVDPVALEHLLAMVHPSHRAELLRFFEHTPDASSARSLIRMNDPVLQQAFEAAWVAPGAEPHRGRAAERSREARTAPMQLALVSDFRLGGREADAVVLHRADGHDLILLRERDADATKLLAAQRQLLRSRREHGLRPAQDRVISIHVDAAALPPGELQEQAVRDLRRAPRRPVAGLGEARVISFSFPGVNQS